MVTPDMKSSWLLWLEGLWSLPSSPKTLLPVALCEFSGCPLITSAAHVFPVVPYSSCWHPYGIPFVRYPMKYFVVYLFEPSSFGRKDCNTVCQAALVLKCNVILNHLNVV